MTELALAIGVLIAGLGVIGVASPVRLLGLVERAVTRQGLYVLALLRLAVGATLILAAPESRAPLPVRILGGVAIVSGILTPIVGSDRAQLFLTWWRARGEWVRAWACLAVTLGGWLVWAMLPT